MDLHTFFASIAIATLAMHVATTGVGMLDQKPRVGSLLIWGGIATIVAIECLISFMLL